MSNSRRTRTGGRFIAVLLAFVVMICLVPAEAFANSVDGKAEISIEAPASVTPAAGYSPGDTFTVPVVIADNPGFVAAAFNFVYDASVLDVAGTKYETLTLNKLISETVYPQWTVDFNPADAGQNRTLTVGLQNQPLIAAVSDLDPQVASNGGNRNFAGNGTLFEVTFRVKDDAVGGTYTLGIHNRLDSVKNFSNHLLQGVPVNYTGTTFKIAAVGNVTGVKFGQKSLNLVRGKTVAVTPAVYPADGPKTSLTWASSNTRVATVTGSGKIKGVKVGSARITATAENGQKATLNVKVVAQNKAVKVSSVKINAAPKTLQVGKARQLKAAVSPVKATGAVVKWKSSNSRILTVDPAGLITAKKGGRATVTLTVGGRTSRAVVLVADNVTSVKITGAPQTLQVGKSKRLKAVTTPSNAKNVPVKWKSSNSRVLKVDQKGKITAVREGKANITLTVGGKSIRVTVQVSDGVPAVYNGRP